MSVIPQDLQRIFPGGREIPARTWNALVAMAEDYARLGEYPRGRAATAYVKLQAEIAKDATGSVKFCEYDPATGWHETSDAFSALNIGPSTAPSGAVVPVLHGQRDVPHFQYFATSGGGDESSSQSGSDSSSSSDSGSSSGDEITATLTAETVRLAANEDGVYSNPTVLATKTVAAAGKYIVSGQVVYDTSDGVTAPQLTIEADGVQVSYQLESIGPSANAHLVCSPVVVDLAANDVVNLIGYAYADPHSGEGALGEGESGLGATYLTIVGPLEMDVS
jgi:hypothetical protein